MTPKLTLIVESGYDWTRMERLFTWYYKEHPECRVQVYDHVFGQSSLRHDLMMKWVQYRLEIKFNIMSAARGWYELEKGL